MFAKYKFLLITLVLFLSLTACSDSSETNESAFSLAPASNLSEEIRSAPQAVQEAYRFALANPEILEEIPCYCGCGSVGHKNNLQCYVSGVGADGKPIFDSHALG